MSEWVAERSKSRAMVSNRRDLEVFCYQLLRNDPTKVEKGIRNLINPPFMFFCPAYIFVCCSHRKDYPHSLASLFLHFTLAICCSLFLFLPSVASLLLSPREAHPRPISLCMPTGERPMALPSSIVMVSWISHDMFC